MLCRLVNHDSGIAPHTPRFNSRLKATDNSLDDSP